MHGLRRRVLKTTIFMVLDIIMVMLYTFIWFKFIHESIKEIGPANESLVFTIGMEALVFTYYFIFDMIYD